MGFMTRLDYSNNRQLKQFQFTNTTLSGSTTFGVADIYIPENYTGYTINIDALQFIRTRGFILIDGTQQAGYVLTSGADGKGTWQQPLLNTYLSGGTFNTTTGDLGLSILSGDTLTINLDGRYLTSETDSQTLSFSANTGNLAISSGNTVNLGFTSGDTTNWNSTYNDSITGITVTGTTNKTISLFQRDGSLLQANFIDEVGVGTGNDYVTGGTFNTLTGDLTLSRFSGGTVVTNFDGRYSLTGHTHDFNSLTNTGHTHTVSEVTDFPTNVSYFTNDVSYLTGYTETPQTLSYTASTGQLSISSGNTVTTVIPTGLEVLNEGNGVGWRLIGRNPTEYGNIGLNAIDFGCKYVLANIGSIGEQSVTFGEDNINNSYAGFVMGYKNTTTSNANYCVVAGHTNYARGFGGAMFGNANFNRGDSTSGANYTLVSGRNVDTYIVGGIVAGLSLKAASVGTAVFGQANVEYMGTTNSANTLIDPIFVVGNGTVNNTTLIATSRSDAFRILLNGLITAPSLTTAMITAESTGRVLVTREFLTGHTTGATSGMTQSLSFSASTGDLAISDGNTVNLDGRYLTGYTQTIDANDYITGSTFNTSTGILTSTRLSGGTFTTNFDGRYTQKAKHIQISGSTSWMFNHGLNELHPNITIYDSNNKVTIPQDIESIDANNVTITFSIATSGVATAIG